MTVTHEPNEPIVAVVPAEGHEYLTAPGPYREHPATLLWVVHTLAGGRTGTCPDEPRWATDYTCPRCGGSFMSALPGGRGAKPWRTALILSAPGDPQLGRVRALKALGVQDWTCIRSTETEGVWIRTHTGSVHRFMGPRPSTSIVTLSAWTLGRRLVGRGLGAEVLLYTPE